MLTISEQTWQQLLEEARAAIEQMNARCIGDYANYSHKLEVDDGGEFVFVTAIQHKHSKYSMPPENRYLGWRKADGALMKVTCKVHRTKTTRHRDFYGKPVTAKSWAQAAAKSPKHLLEMSGLVRFMMIGKAYAVGVETIG